MSWLLRAVTRIFTVGSVHVDNGGTLAKLVREFWSLGLGLRYFPLVVNWGANVQDWFRRIYYWSISKRLFKEPHLLLTGLLLHLVCGFDVYHFFLEFFQKLIYSWLIFSRILSTCAIVLELLYKTDERIVLYTLRMGRTNSTGVRFLASCCCPHCQVVMGKLRHVGRLPMALVACF